MKSIYIFISYILWILLIILAFMNLHDVQSVCLMNTQASEFLAQNIHINFPVSTINIKTPVLFLILFVLGELAGIAFLMPLYKSGCEKLQAYKRELEKGSVTNSSSTSKIEVLENKIKVLEKALNDSLKKNMQ